MAKVVVFHYTEEGRLPKLNKKELEDIMNQFYEVLKDYPEVKFNGTYVGENGMGFCDWDGTRCGSCERDREESAGGATQRPNDCGEAGVVVTR